uniref:C-X-C motif chemokine n=1 Tax=Oryzias melastigma TaxID=30732 RepID=A0A3B3C4Q3_ORYME
KQMVLCIISSIMCLLKSLAMHGCSLTVQGMNLRCLCITKERALIGRLIGAVEVNLASSYCTEVEIIATLVKSEKKICLDPEASWVKKVKILFSRWTP